jgi:hypothetical protein
MKLFIIFFSITNLFFAQKEFENDSILLWNSNRKLEWSDFISNNKKHSYEKAVAVISPYLVLIPKRFSKKTASNMKIAAINDKKSSWNKTTEQSVLIHEQGHFDITEIHARKFRKALFETKQAENVLDVHFIVTLYKNIDSEHWKLQEKYEIETEHGTNYNSQTKWNDFISKELEILKDFEETICVDDLK